MMMRWRILALKQQQKNAEGKEKRRGGKERKKFDQNRRQGLQCLKAPSRSNRCSHDGGLRISLRVSRAKLYH